MNYAEHNAEVKEVWRRFHENNPIRMPMVIGIDSRFYILNPQLNSKKVTYKQYMENPDVMFETMAEMNRYKRLNIVADHMMGYPEEEGGWNVWIDFQSVADPAWLGCDIFYPDNECPFTGHMLNENNRNILFEKGLPDPFSSWSGRARDYYEYWQKKKEHFILDGYPVASIDINYLGTAGPFTVACDLLGASEACVLMCEDPDYMQQLLNYITDAVIERVKAWRKYLGQPEFTPSFPFGDDSISLLSPDMYREFVLPCHKKLVTSLSTMEKPGQAHLCGDATRHYKIMTEELNIGIFETGYPVKHGELVKELGSDIQIQGGPTPDLLKFGKPEAILAEAKRIIDEVKPYTKKFVLREGFNTAPGTPLENIIALHDAAKMYGQY